MNKKILVTGIIPDDGLDILRRRFDLTIHDTGVPMTHGEIVAGIRGAAGLLCLLTDRIDDEVMDASPGLLGIANYAAGFDNIDIAAATTRGIPVSNTPGVLTGATAELTVALIFACARRIPESERYLRAGRFKGWGPMLLMGADIEGATLGIVGMGKIGRAVAKRGHGLGMTIVYHEDAPVDEASLGFPARRVQLTELLAISDFVSLHVPLTEKTGHLIGRAQLALMKPTAFLINTSRGKVLEEDALADALSSGTIAGAGLDVFEREPEVSQKLLTLDNCVLLPHIGSATTTTRRKMSQVAAENLVAMIEGRDIPNLINPDYRSQKRRE